MSSHSLPPPFFTLAGVTKPRIGARSLPFALLYRMRCSGFVAPLVLAMLAGACMSDDGDHTLTTDARACPSDGDSCTRETHKRGKCVSVPLADGTTCDMGGTCQAGACVIDEGGAPDGGVSPDGGSSSAGKPGSDNTGVPAGTVLTTYSGPLTITVDGTVIDGKQISGGLEIYADNVTVRRSQLTTSIVVRNARNVLIEDVSLQSVAVSSAQDVTVRRADLSGAGEDALHVTSDSGSQVQNVLIENSWIHNPQPPPGAHWDGIQVRGISGLTLSHNNFDLGVYQSEYNAAIYFEQANGGNSHLFVNDNWINGGAFLLMLSVGIPDVNFNRNRMGRDYHWGPCYQSVTMNQSDNVWDDTGLPVTLCP
jgi:hypothetical protein